MESRSQFSVTEDAPWVRHGESPCPIDTTLRLIGGKWKPRVVHRLREGGPLRYSDLRRHLTGISSQVLTTVLREMEHDGLVERGADYRLTPLGESLRPVLEAMCAWGEAYRAGAHLTKGLG